MSAGARVRPQLLFGVVVGGVAAFGVLLVGSIGAAAGAPGWAWALLGAHPTARMSGLLVGFGATWLALLLVGNNRCDPASCVAPDLTPWLVVGGLLLGSGLVGLALDRLTRPERAHVVAGLLVSVPAWLALVSVGRVDTIHAFVGLGPLVLVPLGLDLALALVPGAPPHLATAIRSLAAPAAAPVALSLVAPASIGSAILATPWLAVALAAGLVGAANGAHWLVALVRRRPSDVVAPAISAGLLFLAVSAVWLVIDRLGGRPLALDSAIVALTSVHFVFAGFLTVLLASLAARETRTRLGTVAVALLVAGIPLTAAGFIGLPAASVAGALVVGLGGIATAAIQWQAARDAACPVRLVLRISSVALAGGMLLALVWATSTAIGRPFLELPTMAAVHGTLNALGYGAPSVVARWTTSRA